MIQLEDKLYTSTEVADILGVSLRSVYRYLEEGKIDAEVKTATGRHRFSKKNILDFLYPNGAQPAPAQPAVTKPARTDKVPVVSAKKKIQPIEEPVIEVETEEEVSETMEEEQPKEEPIDWLAKFREAAKKYREEAEQPAVENVETDTMSMADAVPAPKETPAPKVEKSREPHKNYYRSNLGGLKDIAQNLDRGSRNSYLDYAFTMNAGLSLFKPIRPFSVLHAYVREGDLAFFEKLLGLTPTDESNAQLCLILSDDDNIYRNKEELHGLYVVTKKKLLADIEIMGDSALVAEASSILN
jgi:excisionase family DNA binding protein